MDKIKQEILFKIMNFIGGIAKIIYFYLEAFYRQIVPPPMKAIDGETILITGAIGAIGRELCKHLVKRGNNLKLILWDLNLDALEKFAGELQASNSTVKVFSFAVDISAKDNINRTCKEVNEKVGPPSIIFNNAGILPSGNFLQLTNDDIERTIQINLLSHLWTLKHFLPNMITNNYGRIVNTCSIGGLIACPYSLPYMTSKFAVNGYAEALKCELQYFQCDGVHLTTVYPWFVQSSMLKSLFLKNDSGLLGPFKKFLNPEDVAKSAIVGMRREYEYVYCPSVMPLIVLTNYLIPRKLRKEVHRAIFPNFAYKDEEKKFHETYLDTLGRGVAKNGK